MIILAWISVIHAYIGAGIFDPGRSKQFINGMNWRSEPSSVRQKNNMETIIDRTQELQSSSHGIVQSRGKIGESSMKE
jgi:hypothetical protein